MDLSKVNHLDLVKEITRRDNPKYLFLYDYWEVINKDFFKGELSPCLVYQAVQPYGRSVGYIRGNVREIAIQRNLDRKDIFLILIHEMCHQWQFEKSPIEVDRKRIHYDKSWAMILNNILTMFNSEYRAVEYLRRKKTIDNERINIYVPIIPPELEKFKHLSKKELQFFPSKHQHHKYLPHLDINSYI